jgi:hypothetical protein
MITPITKELEGFYLGGPHALSAKDHRTVQPHLYSVQKILLKALRKALICWMKHGCSIYTRRELPLPA